MWEVNRGGRGASVKVCGVERADFLSGSVCLCCWREGIEDWDGGKVMLRGPCQTSQLSGCSMDARGNRKCPLLCKG